MCGLAGYVTRNAIDPALLARMASALRHRGPDDEGIWVDPEAGVGLVHRRLAIVDLSPAGHQPMASSDGRWLISFNGEIYNHRALRNRLVGKGMSPEGGWRGTSDTETLVAAIAAWGLETTLLEAVGMFALAAWDRASRSLHLARDRFGEKPLYFGWAGSDFVFGSELKALRPHPRFDTTIDRGALAAYTARNVIPTPRSIYAAVRKLRPGHILTLSTERLTDGDAALNDRPYWEYREMVEAGAADPFTDENAALEALDMALRDALAGQTVADVPVGAFLSGGIDSSTVAALYQAVSGARIKTYTIGFDEAGYDESADARRVAAHLGTEHHEHRVGVNEARDVIPLLPHIYDEPFADSSQIPTFLVSRFARNDVTVAISGDGGDELFAGYNRHTSLPSAWRRVSMLPKPLRRVGSALISAVPPVGWTGLASVLGKRAPGVGRKMARGAKIAAAAASIEELYREFLDEWSDDGSPVLSPGSTIGDGEFPAGVDDVTRLTFADATGYLPDDILTKLDRASMAVSLEARVPLLDHRVAAVAARMPTAMKLRGGKGKQPLRALLHRHVPPALVDRPKAGFAVPIGGWIRGPLRDWAETLLEERRLRAGGFFDPEVVRARWHAHIRGEEGSAAALWAVLMFESWRDAQSSG